MDCKKATRKIPAFIRNDLQIKDLEEFMMHVEHCPECKEELTIQLLVTEGLLSLEDGDDFDIKREMEEKMQQARRRLGWQRELDWLALGIGLVMLCIGILLTIWLVL